MGVGYYGYSRVVRAKMVAIQSACYVPICIGTRINSVWYAESIQGTYNLEPAKLKSFMFSDTGGYVWDT